MKWKQIISEVDLDIKPERANEGKHFAIWGGGGGGTSTDC